MYSILLKGVRLFILVIFLIVLIFNVVNILISFFVLLGLVYSIRFLLEIL